MRRVALGAAMIAGLSLSSAPAPGLTPVPVSVSIPFEKGSADLTEGTRSMMAGVPSFIHYAGKRCINVRISGHLDRAEAKAGNGGRLDLRRATTVRDVLRTVPILEGYAFDVFAYADERPEVPNAADDEPRNRRVVIDWECAKAR